MRKPKKIPSYKIVDDFEIAANANGDYYQADDKTAAESKRAKEILCKAIARDRKKIAQLKKQLELLTNSTLAAKKL